MTPWVPHILGELGRREARARWQAEERARQIRARLPALARLLRERYGVDEVRLIGSLAWGHPTATSDVDLVVTGLDAGRLAAASSDARDLVGAAVELLRLEDAPASLRERSRREGIAL